MPRRRTCAASDATRLLPGALCTPPHGGLSVVPQTQAARSFRPDQVFVFRCPDQVQPGRSQNRRVVLSQICAVCALFCEFCFFDRRETAGGGGVRPWACVRTTSTCATCMRDRPGVRRRKTSSPASRARMRLQHRRRAGEFTSPPARLRRGTRHAARHAARRRCLLEAAWPGIARHRTNPGYTQN